MQDGKVHGEQNARERQNRQADPFAAAALCWIDGRKAHRLCGRPRGETSRAGNNLIIPAVIVIMTRAFKSQLTVLMTMFLAMWAVFLLTSITGGFFLYLGVIPRTVIGLRGILFAPFLHGSLNHIVANSIPFLLFGWLILLRDPRHFVPVTMMAMIGSGMMAWLFGAPGSIHIGASGVIFGYLGFLMLSGWFARSFASIALSVVVIFLWGGMVIGVMPGATGISWQAHLGGLIAGIYAARSYRTPRIKA